MRCVLLSDTHNRHYSVKVPDGDVLVHAGDLTMRGTLSEIGEAIDWLVSLPHRHKLFIAGNHDFAFQESPEDARALVPPELTYLEDSGITIEGRRFWGAPWQPWFHDWAFNLSRGPELARCWQRIPEETEVLITHGPPFGILDRVTAGESVGCQDLTARLTALAELRIHAFGHIHEARGVLDWGGKRFVNAACCDRRYRPTGVPVVVDLD